MAKYYEITRYDGSSTASVLITRPEVKNGAIYATQVGEWDGNENNEKNMFCHCEPSDIIVIGNAMCRGRKNPFSDLSEKEGGESS